MGSLGEHDVYVTLNLVKPVNVEITPGPVIPGYEEKVQKKHPPKMTWINPED